MTRGLCSLFQRLTIVGRASKQHVSLLKRMPKKPTQNPSEREAKASLRDPAIPGNVPCADQRPNLNPAPPLRTAETMSEATTGDDGRRGVEYLDTPVKSEMDKKEYRLGDDADPGPILRSFPIHIRRSLIVPDDNHIPL